MTDEQLTPTPSSDTEAPDGAVIPEGKHRQSIAGWKNIFFGLGGLVLLILMTIGYILVYPQASNELIFRGTLTQWPIVFSFVLVVMGLVALWRRGKLSLRVVLMALALDGLPFLVAYGQNAVVEYITYRTYAQFTSVEALVRSDERATRYTALQSAYTEMSRIDDAERNFKREYVRPDISDDGHFRFIGPITPDGAAAKYTAKNPGFMVYDDAPFVSGRRTRSVLVDQTYGFEKPFHMSIMWRVYLTDWFATYDKAHFIQLDPKNEKSIVSVFPKIKYDWLLIPRWGGAVIVHGDGKIEDLSREEVLKDERLRGEWVVPTSLGLHYIKLQNYQVGLAKFFDFWRVTGKHQVEQVPGSNQAPFLFRNADGRRMFWTSTRPAGTGTAIYRMYYFDAHDFSLSYFESREGETLIGPAEAIERAQLLDSYNWAGTSSDDHRVGRGNHIPTEAVYHVPAEGPARLYWKVGITVLSYKGTAGVAVVDAANPDEPPADFKSRNEFLAWASAERASADKTSDPTAVRPSPGVSEDLAAEESPSVEQVQTTSTTTPAAANTAEQIEALKAEIEALKREEEIRRLESELKRLKQGATQAK